MNEGQLNKILLNTFPELAEKFEEYTSWQDGMETGCFITFEDLLHPFVQAALDDNNEEILVRFSDFIEELLTCGDEYAANVATVGSLELLKAEGYDSFRSTLGPVSLRIYDELTY